MFWKALPTEMIRIKFRFNGSWKGLKEGAPQNHLYGGFVTPLFHKNKQSLQRCVLFLQMKIQLTEIPIKAEKRRAHHSIGKAEFWRGSSAGKAEGEFYLILNVMQREHLNRLAEIILKIPFGFGVFSLNDNLVGVVGNLQVIEQDGKLLDNKIQLLLGKMIAGVGSQKDVMHGEGGNILLQQGLCV